MRRVSAMSLWLAGVAAILGALGILSLNFDILFIQIDALLLVVGTVCMLNAWFR